MGRDVVCPSLYPKTKDVQLVALVVVIKVWVGFIHVGVFIASEEADVCTS